MPSLVTESSKTPDKRTLVLLDLVDASVEYGQALERRDRPCADAANREMLRAFHAALEVPS